jgi:hypothetical protein
MTAQQSITKPTAVPYLVFCYSIMENTEVHMSVQTESVATAALELRPYPWLLLQPPRENAYGAPSCPT